MQPTMAKAQSIDLIEAAKSNDAFRRVIETGEHEQVVVMTIPVDSDIGAEVHSDTDQVFIFIAGKVRAEVGGDSRDADEGDLLYVRAGTKHNIINRGDVPLRLITIYAPPNHAPGTVHLTKAEAEAAGH